MNQKTARAFSSITPWTPALEEVAAWRSGKPLGLSKLRTEHFSVRKSASAITNSSAQADELITTTTNYRIRTTPSLHSDPQTSFATSIRVKIGQLPEGYAIQKQDRKVDALFVRSLSHRHVSFFMLALRAGLVVRINGCIRR